jgi:hypothetical protein
VEAGRLGHQIQAKQQITLLAGQQAAGFNGHHLRTLMPATAESP